MRIKVLHSLFPWDQLEDPPDRAVVCRFSALLEDGPLFNALARARGRGRNAFPSECRRSPRFSSRCSVTP